MIVTKKEFTADSNGAWVLWPGGIPCLELYGSSISGTVSVEITRDQTNVVELSTLSLDAAGRINDEPLPDDGGEPLYVRLKAAGSTTPTMTAYLSRVTAVHPGSSRV